MKKNILIFIVLLATMFSFAQKKKKDTIGTEVINVVRPYSPTISDAFKITSNPEISDEEITQKEKVDYKITSAPVASTFTPSKGKAKSIKITPSSPAYDNFVSGALGLYRTISSEAFVRSSSNKYNNFGGYFNFLSSKAGVSNSTLDTDFLDTKLNLFYKHLDRNYDWQLNGGARLQHHNWYGLSDEIAYTSSAINGLNVSQKYTTVNLGGKIDYRKSYFKGAKASAYMFGDAAKSGEVYIHAKPRIELPISNEILSVDGRFEFLNGKFKRDFEDTDDLDHTYFNIGVTPSLDVAREKFSLNLGANVLFSTGSGSYNEAKLYFYPNVTASYIVSDEVLTIYTGIVGDLVQNTYRGFVDENPFVSPTLKVKRTDKQYDAFLGFRGKLASNINYNFKGGYTKERDKALYKLNPSKVFSNEEVTYGYQVGNSFQVIYDDVETMYALAEIGIDLTKTFTFGGNVAFNTYSTDAEKEAWNLPQLNVGAYANFNNNNWFAGADLYFVTNRKDEVTFSVENQTYNPIAITNGSYVDLNANIGYKFSERLTAFGRVNNILNTNYQKYTNFKVQGLQILAGLTYKFDVKN